MNAPEDSRLLDRKGSALSDFTRELAAELARSRFNDYSDNYDTIQRGPVEPPSPGTSPQWRQLWGEFTTELSKLSRQVSATMAPIVKGVDYYILPRKFFNSVIQDYKDVSFLYSILENKESKQLLVKLFAYRILGWRKVKLPRNNERYWADIGRMASYRTAAPPMPIAFQNMQLAQYDFGPLGYDVKAYASDVGAACVFVQKQYEYHCGDVHCKVEPGDVVIDAGACWGETSIYFAHEVGPQGKVVAFEFIPSNLQVLQANLDANPDLAARVAVGARPVWSHVGFKLYYVDWGPGSRVTSDERKYNHQGTCLTATIDAVSDQNALARVDFIKMDIEGAEFPALKGATRTIRTWRPKLAISLYHQISDFITIPRWLHELDLGYKFYLDHHTIYENETVLFAIPPKGPEPPAA